MLITNSVIVIKANEPIVKIRNGQLLGSYMYTKNGRKFSAFQGIPYAKPPLGELRFQVTFFKFEKLLEYRMRTLFSVHKKFVNQIKWDFKHLQVGLFNLKTAKISGTNQIQTGFILI